MDGENNATGRILAQTAAACMFQNAAIVGALAQAGSINPLDVAKWSELFMAEPTLDDIARGQLSKFAALIRSMAITPAGAGRA